MTICAGVSWPHIGSFTLYNGIAGLAEVVVLEIDGRFTVVPKLAQPDKPTLENVRG